MESVAQGRRYKQTLADLHPHLRDEWHPENTKAFDSVTPGSAYKALWICNGHTRELEVYRKLRGVKCRECATPITVTHPELAAEWDPENDVPASEVTQGMARTAKWICAAGHRWEARVHSRSAGRGCQQCFLERKAEGHLESGSLADTHPDYAEEWSEENDLPATKVTHGSKYVAVWQCRENPEHTWTSTVMSRTSNATGCPKCSVGRKASKVEDELRSALESMIVFSDSKDTGCRWGNGVTMTADLIGILPDGSKVAIEYDGSYWHQRTTERDVRKTTALLDAGYVVVRVREQSRAAQLDYLPITHENLHQVKHEYAYRIDQDFSSLTKIF